MNRSRFSEPMLTSELLADPLEGRELTTACPHCGRTLLTSAGLWVQCDESDPQYERVVGLERVCSCEVAMRAREEEKRALRAVEELELKTQVRIRFEHLWAQSGMPRAWQERGMRCWVRETAQQKLAYDIACEFGRQFVAGNRPGILFVAGDIGCGKSFLASCLCADLVRSGKVVKWCNVSDVLRDIRRSFNNPRVSEDEVVSQYTGPGILVLDDLGKERPTEWALEQLFCIVNARYDRQRALVVTTNYGGEELVRRLTPRPDAEGFQDDTTARAIVDRLRAMSHVVTLVGESWRKSAAY